MPAYASWIDERPLILGLWALAPLLERLQGIMQAAVAHGYFPAVSKGEDLIVLDPQTGDESARFTFPRPAPAPGRLLAAAGVR